MLLAAWLLYFTLHSVLASLWLKRRVAARWPYLMPAYRLGFNLLALVGLVTLVADLQPAGSAALGVDWSCRVDRQRPGARGAGRVPMVAALV